MQIEDEVLALINENQKDIEISYDEFKNLEFVPYAAYDVSFKYVKDVTDRVKVLKLKDGKYIVDCPSTGTLLGDRFYKIDKLEDINQVIEQHFKDLDYQDIEIVERKIRSTQSESFGQDKRVKGVVDKRLAVFRYLCGVIALETAYTIKYYNEDTYILTIDNVFEEYDIEVKEDATAILFNTPDGEHMEFEAEVELDLVSGQNINVVLNNAINLTKKELYPQLKDFIQNHDKEELSLMAQDILSEFKEI